MPWRPSADGQAREPDLPEGVEAEHLASVPGGAWLLMELHAPELPPRCVRLPEALRLLVQSALAWPPALALARERLEAREGPLSLERSATEFGAELERELRGQPEAPYFLARARREHLIGYLWAGQYAWLVARDPAGQVGWVTGDYFVYFDPAEDFEADPARLARLPMVRRG